MFNNQMCNNQMLNKMFNTKYSPMCNASCVLIEERLWYINLMIEEHKLITDTTVALNIMFMNNVMSCYDDITNTINIEFNNSDKVIIKLFENYFNNVKKFIESVNKLSDDYMLSNTIFQTNLNTMICLNNMLVEKLNELRND